MANEMDRRSFLKAGGAVAVVAGVVEPALARETMAAGREVLPINRGWRYSPQTSAAAREPGFDDSGFATVTVPHSNIPLPWHGFADSTYEFVSVYRRHFKTPAGSAGKRVFVDFEGAMTASTVYLNGKLLGQYKGGYTPFSFELTGGLAADGNNVLTVELDSTERKDIPPFGFEVDYLTFGGIYREVAIRTVPQIFIENIHAQTRDVLTEACALDVACYLDRGPGATFAKLEFKVELRDGDRVIARGQKAAAMPPVREHHPADADQAMGALPYDPAKDAPAATVRLDKLHGKVALWGLGNGATTAQAGSAAAHTTPAMQNGVPAQSGMALGQSGPNAAPKLYTVVVQLLDGGKVIDEDVRRVGFREAMFTPQGFSLNGTVVKLHGLDRHQTFPWAGQAMPERVQRQDARILRHDMRCNIVRTSHYPQSRHFLDECDEIGLLVLEEIPGWQHIGPAPWKDIAVDNVRRMVRRDWNRPSVILWGVRINESQDDHDFYTRTNALSHALDTTRQTGGIRYLYDTELLEDVMTMNDFGWPLRKPNHPRYLNTEFVGHTYPTKTIDSLERLREHTIRHARIHDQLASDPQYAGGIGWCAFDYTTHANFGSGDRICYHGVMDIFRTPKPAAGFYKSMCEPAEEIVLEPAFHWARNDESVGITYAFISSNVDHIKMYTVAADGTETFAGEGDPDRKQFGSLKHAPFTIPFIQEALGFPRWGDLRMDGYIGGQKVISRTLGGDGVDHRFRLVPDETTLKADGADTVRVVLRSEDAFGNIRPFAADAISFKLDGPAEMIGDNPFGLIGGTGAVWIRTQGTAGPVTLTATHPRLGSTTATFNVVAVAPEVL